MTQVGGFEKVTRARLLQRRTNTSRCLANLADRSTARQAVGSGVLPYQVAAQDAAAEIKSSHHAPVGEVVYVPVYSHLLQGEKGLRQPLSSTLVIHNVNPGKTIRVISVRYYDHSGTQLKDYIDAPHPLGPFASANFVVDIREDQGGVGANVIVEWQASEPGISPIIEAIMNGGAGTQGLSFVTRGKVIETRP